nr:hypothetical protein CFP56_34847 [Quercus suber]
MNPPLETGKLGTSLYSHVSPSAFTVSTSPPRPDPHTIATRGCASSGGRRARSLYDTYEFNQEWGNEQAKLIVGVVDDAVAVAAKFSRSVRTGVLHVDISEMDQ